MTEKDVPGFRHESGTHRIQRVPVTDGRGRVHSSTVTVSVLDGRRRTFDGLRDQDLSIRWFSGTGAGGQHRNKHQNSIELTHVPTGISRSAQTRSRQNSMTEARTALELAVREHAETASATETNDLRRGQIGGGSRGERRRLWRFRDDAVRDEITGMTTTCTRAMRGGIDALWPAEDRLRTKS